MATKQYIALMAFLTVCYTAVWIGTGHNVAAYLTGFASCSLFWMWLLRNKYFVER